MKHLPKAIGWLLLLFCLARASTGRGQAEAGVGSVFGQITETDTSAGLAGATVTIEGAPFKAESGSDGNYVIQDIPPGYYQLLFNKVGYDRRRVEQVEIKAGEATRLDAELRLELYELEPFEVVADPFSGLDGELLLERQEANIIFDAIGAAQISRSGYSDAAGLLTKVTGATIVDGKTAVIRGLSDRYTSATLNGAEIPSADPYRKSAQLDMIPSSVINEMTVTKTFLPDQPGSFTGGSIDITTKTFPEEFIFNFTTTLGYNTQSTFNDEFLASDGGSTDWLGFDDGGRKQPPEISDPGNPPPLPPSRAGRLDTPEDDARRLQQALELQAANRALGQPQFEGHREAPPLNHKFDISMGDTVLAGDRPLGYFATLTYNHKYQYDDDGVYSRYRPGRTDQLKLYRDQRGVDEVGWAAMANVAYELTEDHKISFNFLKNQSGENNVRQRIGQNYQETPGNITHLNAIHYLERSLTSFVLQGEHRLENLGALEADWMLSFANTTQEEPDLRYFNHYVRELSDGDTQNSFANSLEAPNRPSRYWRDLDEDNYNGKLDFRAPFDQWSGLEADVKFGAYGSFSRRTFSERTFAYDSQNASSDWLANGSPNDYLSEDNLGYNEELNSRGQTNYVFQRYITESGRSSYRGQQDVNAFYLMSDLPLNESFTLVGGFRVESTDLSVDGGLTSSEIVRTDVLPAVGLIYTFHDEQMKLRFNFGQTVARPTYREIADYRSYDVTGDEVLEGNPDLQMSEIRNYDLRWDWFTGPGEVISAGVFYKSLKNPIEKYFVSLDGSIITYINRESAEVYGLELEARKNLSFLSEMLEPFSLGLNMALIESEAPLTAAELSNKQLLDPGVSSSRPMYDQSPLIFNVDLNFDKPEWNSRMTLNYNYTAERIYLASGVGDDIYEHPGYTVNFTWIQDINEHWSAKFAAKNILNPVTQRTYGEKPDQTLYSETSAGTVFELALSYSY